MDVLLIWPPLPDVYSRLPDADRTVAPPLGLASIAAVLRDQGSQVGILDMAGARMAVAGLPGYLSQRRPAIVGVSCLMANMSAPAAEVCRAVRESLPSSLLVVGGNHATFQAETVLRAARADAVALYEGEATMAEVVRAAAAGDDLAGVPGLALPSADGVRLTAPRQRIAQLDRLPPPARELLDLANYDEKYRGIIITSRGCPYRCAYCSTAAFNGRKVRARSVPLVLDEIGSMVLNHGIPIVTFVDDTFTFDRRRTAELCQGIAERFPGLNWSCETRVDLVDAPLLELMRRAGCRTIFYGVESAHQPALDRTFKGFTVEQARRAVRLTREAGIDTQVSFIIGLPEEDGRFADRALNFIRETAPGTVMCGMLAVYPGTPMWDRPGEFGIRDFSTDWRASQQLTPMTDTEWLDRDGQKRCYVRLALALAAPPNKEE